MRIAICTMDDPVYTVPFIKEVIQERQADIVAVAVSAGDRLTIGKRRSKKAYVLSLFLIMGPFHFAKYALTTFIFKVRSALSERLGLGRSPSVLSFADSLGIPTFRVRTVNDPDFIEKLRALKPDVIINQTQSILKANFLSVPRIGVLNRHNALLPLNRGRLTPFWVLYYGDQRTGVSIHFVDERLDAGPIIVQEAFDVEPNDDFNSIVAKNYRIAPKAMLEALRRLEEGVSDYIPNDDSHASYNTVPTLSEAWAFRWSRIIPSKQHAMTRSECPQ